MRKSGKVTRENRMYDPDFLEKTAQIIAGKKADFWTFFIIKKVFVSLNNADLY